MSNIYLPSQLAQKTGLTLQAITKACREGRIEGAYQIGNRWIIPFGFFNLER